jgi:membrane-associated phospholipid phosphatase
LKPTSDIRTEAAEAIVPIAERLTVGVGLLVIFAVLFLGVNQWTAQRVSDGAPSFYPEIAIDAYIPFVPIFVFGYTLYYAWLFLPMLLLRTRAQFYQVMIGFNLVQLPALLFFLLYPSRMTRPLVPGHDIASRLVHFLYRLDPGFNLLPSLHVGHSVLVALFFHTFRPKSTWVTMGSVLIIVSTVLIKQHVVLDVLSGIALAVAARMGAPAIYQRLSRGG